MTWWNIQSCHGIFYGMAKKNLTSHWIFCHLTSMVCFEINNGLLTLHMGLAKRAMESNIMWAFESKKNLKDTFYHPSCNQCSKCLMLLDNNYNIFKNVEMGGICILKKYLMKIKFSKYIKYLTNMCWNGRGIIHKYTSHFTMMEKLQSGEKNHWALLKSKLPT